ncbi:Putative nuclease HARBI1 [Trachymyrmex cornetzi]|uniref:Putative nuclease HARBI1 n=1 Tax=Trachymyrmex cornetzi TaxID=471704 RepID=A0A151J6C2_9HYME|nr:Putative nuclease HARBI1 [Trachymyrmex cornetzi]
MKYFRNAHFAAAKYKQAGGKALVMPQDVRWNILADCLESYINNWHILSKVCTDNRAAISLDISYKIHDMDLKISATNYLEKLKVISVALDVSDYYGKILAVKTNHGGRTHDARVWSSSQLSRHMLREYENGRRNAWLIGDSGYPLLPFLMTPKLNQPPRSPGASYTDSHVRARCSIEKTIGELKGRWRCLRKERALHYAPEFSARIVNATCVLHNIAKHYNVPTNEIYIEDDIEIEEIEIENNVNMRARGNAVRETLIQQYFT